MDRPENQNQLQEYKTGYCQKDKNCMKSNAKF